MWSLSAQHSRVSVSIVLGCFVGGCALKQSGWKDASVIAAKYTNACLEKMHIVPLTCQVAAIIRCGWRICDVMEDAEQRNVLLRGQL